MRVAVVHAGDADLAFGNMGVKAPCAQALSQQIQTEHLYLDVASVVVSNPPLPERPAEIFRCPQRLVSCDRAGGGDFQRLGILARWGHCVGATIGDCVVTLLSIVSAVCGVA